MTSQTVKERITIHILSDISRSNFLKNHAQNIVVKLVLDPFLRKSLLNVSLDQQSEVPYGLF